MHLCRKLNFMQIDIYDSIVGDIIDLIHFTKTDFDIILKELTYKMRFKVIYII